MAGVQHRPGRQQSNSHIMALLSLKVLLLAFFILLNALANFETERSTAVLDSVREAFRGVVPAQQSLSAETAALGVMDSPENVVEALGRLFDDTLPIVERSDAAGGRVLQVDLPIDGFFVESGALVAGEGLDTLRAIAAVLSDRRFAGEDYRLDVLYGLSGTGSGLEGQSLAIRRAGALVGVLEDEDLPANRLSTGLLPSFPGEVRLHFTFPEPSAEAGGSPSEDG